MDFNEKEMELLAEAMDNPEALKQLVIDNFPKFHWRVQAIDVDKCDAIDKFMGNGLSTKTIMRDAIFFLRERIQQVIGDVLKETTGFLCTRIDESVGIKKDVVGEYKKTIKKMVAAR